MTSASVVFIVAVAFVRLPLLMTRFVTPVLSRTARPVPVWLIVPRFVRVALLPVIVTATVLPLTVSVLVASIDPVCPEPDPSVCAVVEDILTRLNDVAETLLTPSATDVMKITVNADACRRETREEMNERRFGRRA